MPAHRVINWLRDTASTKWNLPAFNPITDYAEISMAKHLTVSEFMSTNVTSVAAHDSLLQVASLMQNQNISCVIVLDDPEKSSPDVRLPIGIITERNIVHFIAMHPKCELDKVYALELTPPTLVTIKDTDSLFEAMVLCRSQRVKHLAVVDKNNLLEGIITYSDMVDANYTQIEKQAELLGDDQSCPASINAQLVEMTLTDPMLKIGNRRSMEIDLKQTHELSLRYHRPYSIALIDIDYFKKYNDNYGHQAGDQALIDTANIIKHMIRGGDRLYRYGGEEFLLLMPETTLNAALGAGQRIVKELALKNLPHAYSPLSKITVSAGVASYDGAALTSPKLATPNTAQLIENADSALYQAKNDGRNRAHFFSPQASQHKTA
jgi:diguanylate cyclase (GGDEF)-like protein